MIVNRENPSISFVWRYEDIASSVVDTARRTTTRAIFDLSRVTPEAAGMALLQADASGESVDLKVSAASLTDSRLEDLLNETGIDRIWVEINPWLSEGEPSELLRAMEELSGRLTVIPVLGDVNLITTVLHEYKGIKSIAIKGNEAAGFVGSETIFSLYAAARELIRDRSDGPGLLIWGGIGTAEAAAAFISAGAAGVVFESLHWLTDLSAMDGELRSRVAKLRPDHTDLVGSNLGVYCRLFNKGNSKAVRELKRFAGSLCGAEIRDEQQRFFANRIENEAVHPLASQFGREELIPLGVEATFAEFFVSRYGHRTEEAVVAFVRAIEDCCSDAQKRVTAFVNSPVAARMGTGYPFIQGAMSWITDVPEFALKVAEAGGLPTIALGLMDKQTLDRKLGRLPQVMGNRPYAVNVITLNENPHRDEQLAWIKEAKPRFAVIAAGDPSHGRDLMTRGIEVIYIAPTEDLLRLAFQAGINYVICEGHEAGGHVGAHSTLTLAQIVLDLKHREPALFEGRAIVVAGGVFNRETAFMAAMLGADAVQMGTCYLATREIVETGALTAVYQRMILESQPGGTVVTGEGAGLRVRSLRTPRIDSICSLERDFAAGSEDEGSFRAKIETLGAGSLLVAARGLDRPDGTPLDEATCVREGQFMSGACAGSLRRPITVAALHRELAEGRLAEGLPVTGPIREAVRTRPVLDDLERTRPKRRAASPREVPQCDRVSERIAITGMSVVNSLGNSPEAILQASLALRSGIVEVPATRWDHGLYYHPRPRTSEKTYCKVGAFQNIDVQRKDLGIPPQDFRTMTGSTKITLWLAKRAIEESGILESDIPRERIAVLISQNSGEAAATLEDVIIRGSTPNILSSVKRVLSLTPETEQAVADEVKAGRIVIDDTTLLGRLNCSAGGFICNKYGFMGPSFSVSAACATALVALYSAYQMIRNDVIDAAVVGGAEEFLNPMHFLEFSALGALAGLSGVDRPPSQASRPFDADRDGMVLGEGGGMVVLERESVARKRGAKAYAYITSMGASNNHTGMVESSRQTQEIAIRASFRDASYGPEHVDLVECHATSTRQGDVEEARALKTFFQRNGRTAIASFKSQIGHTLGASGINSLIRGIMAMNAGVLPPTLNYETPDSEMDVEGSGLVVHPEPVDWKLHNGLPRRFQVNAFGFGGSNYVVQVEQSQEAVDSVLVSPDEAESPAADEAKRPRLPKGLFFFQAEISGKPHRAAVLAHTDQEAEEVLRNSDAFNNGGPMVAKRMRALARKGIHLAAVEATPPPLAFVFPGQGSHYAGMGHELYENFPVIRKWMDRAAEVADFDLLRMLFFDREEDLQKTRWQQPALFTMEYALVQYLVSLGIQPTAMAGHSLGELTALCLSGVYSFEDGFRLVNKRAVCMDKACRINVDPGVMMACDAPLDMLEEMIRTREHIYVTNINSPHQIVLGGNSEAVKALGAELKAQGFRSTLLRVSMAFHSPIMACIRDELQEFVATVEFRPPTTPVVSNTTMRPFPDDVEEIKRTVMAHLESPVHWMQNVRTLVTDYNVKLFVEVGPREILSNLIADIVEEADCIQTCLPSVETMIYKTALAQLFARGHLRVDRAVRTVSRTADKDAGAAPLSSSRSASHSPAASFPAVAAPLDQIVHREIVSFIVESFGKFIKPSILTAVRKEHNPSFTEEDLEAALVRMFPTAAAGLALVPQQTAVPAGTTPAPSVGVASTAKAATAGTIATAETDSEDLTEAVIRMIMDATGYERDEIDPDMDLREDLSIRSSRLPVIMDSLEGHFGMKIELEDFMDVRTIRDISDRISEILSRNGPKPKASMGGKAVARTEDLASAVMPDEQQQDIKRLVFKEVPLQGGDVQPVELSPLDQVAVFSAVGGTGLRKKIGDVFRRDYGATIIPLAFMEKSDDPEAAGFDIRTQDGVLSAAENLSSLESLAGMVVMIDDAFESKLNSTEEVSVVLGGLFALLKSFSESRSKKFVLLAVKTGNPNSAGHLLAAGVLGMFLSAAHEFGSVQFRTLRLDETTDLSEAVRGSLDRNRKPMELIHSGGEVFAMEGEEAPTHFDDSMKLTLGPNDVVVFSGGAHGITPFVARSLAPFGCKIVLLGRTSLDPEVDYVALLAEPGDQELAAGNIIDASNPGLSGDERADSITRILKAAEVTATLADLRSAGLDASYYSCDVTNPDQTKGVVDEIVGKHGKIDGIVHSAGILKDNFIRQMSREDFSAVVDVKFLGALNLFQASKDAGLRFFVGLSSAACIQGNPGQVNYAAANRIMSALLAQLRTEMPAVKFKALMLPPIEGAGMAEDVEVRALLKRMKASYVHVNEIAQLFCRELFIAPDDDVWVLFMRSLPDIPAARLNVLQSSPGAQARQACTVAFEDDAFPMIDSVSLVDVRQGVLEASRVFSQQKDLWVTDHCPFEFLKHPIVSAIMALETFMEAARILYPHLRVRGVRNAQFLEMIECPLQMPRPAVIRCCNVGSEGDNVLCDVSITTREVSPSGRLMDRLQSNYRGTVVLSGYEKEPPETLEGFPVKKEQLETRPMYHEEVIEKYRNQTKMQGRYRVIDHLDGTAPNIIRGATVYRHSNDFSDLSATRYQYSPYLLEALMQLVNFYILMRDSSEKRTMIPYGIKEVSFLRRCEDGEEVIVEGRMRNRDDKVVAWDARGLDKSGNVLMTVKGVDLRWFSR